VRRLEYGARLIRKQLTASPVAILFGSEKFGLSNEDLSYCHWLVRIPTVEAHGSMNLGQAVAVCLYELSRQSGAAVKKPERTKRAVARSLDALTSLLVESLRDCGYVHPRVAASTELKIRRLVRRADVSAHDAEIWMGILRQVNWKLRGGEDPHHDNSANSIRPDTASR
jgi:TrmH family RNA methyltransferase